MIVVWTVAILTLVPGLALAASPSDDDAPRAVRLTVSASTERIPLRARGPVELSVDALERRIRLRVGKRDSTAAIAKQVSAHIGLLCPTVKVGDEVGDGVVELRCRSRRIEAQLTPEGKLLYLDINELRGLPWRPGVDAPPASHYDPWRMGLGQHCPGHSEGVQGECELKQGNLLQAAMHFRAALATTDRPLATLRLGDIALRTGDPVTATGWYRRVGAFGAFGRIAGTRLCELDGKCLGSSDEVIAAYAAADLPEPVRAELMLRSARAEAYAGRLPSAERIIVRQARARGRESICRDDGDLLCRRILLEAMREAGSGPALAAAAAAPIVKSVGGVGAQARPRGGDTTSLDIGDRAYVEDLIESYLALPSWEKGPLAVELAQAAAPLAIRLGATTFAGNLLASLAPEVPRERLSDHLLQSAETFLRGQNWARARVVAEYAQTRLKKSELEAPRWRGVLRKLNGRGDEEEVSPATRAAIEAEMIATRAALKDARTVLGEVDGVIETARAAQKVRKSPAPRTTPAAPSTSTPAAGTAVSSTGSAEPGG
jgi:hypothetical protein